MKKLLVSILFFGILFFCLSHFVTAQKNRNFAVDLCGFGDGMLTSAHSTTDADFKTSVIAKVTNKCTKTIVALQLAIVNSRAGARTIKNAKIRILPGKTGQVKLPLSEYEAAIHSFITYETVKIAKIVFADGSVMYSGQSDPGVSEQTDPPRLWVGTAQS
ncbi:hypothetical protein [Spirosoma linguale]|uniref:Uncharacterized protein n=1 Tax=Spirosoma linguale (strain ATCC 33905 / DSM 74 / LMG 10896 / Claus 1) TaxID=504472 RepID=D2QTJ3_SPILD|nr:hypothetical protein Slin_6165 [Spirosoma linguale DSM 74]